MGRSNPNAKGSIARKFPWSNLNDEEQNATQSHFPGDGCSWLNFRLISHCFALTFFDYLFAHTLHSQSTAEVAWPVGGHRWEIEMLKTRVWPRRAFCSVHFMASTFCYAFTTTNVPIPFTCQDCMTYPKPPIVLQDRPKNDSLRETDIFFVN